MLKDLEKSVAGVIVEMSVVYGYQKGLYVQPHHLIKVN